MTLQDFEIMAPVGSRESFAAAINAGAGSIYFGIEKLNMRAHSAAVFTIVDLKEIAATCKEHGIKSYLTVNTVIYGEDLEQMREIIRAAKEAEISAVIASDVAVMMYCKWCYTDGKFTYQKKEDLLDFLVKAMPNPDNMGEDERRKLFDSHLSLLKHWS